MPLIVTLMLGMWQFGGMAQMVAGLEGCRPRRGRVAAGGRNNGTTVTVANVQTAVQNYLTGAGMRAAVNGATITVTNSASDIVDRPRQCLAPGRVSVTVTIPAGTPSTACSLLATTLCGVTQLQSSVTWLSANDTQITVIPHCLF